MPAATQPMITYCTFNTIVGLDYCSRPNKGLQGAPEPSLIHQAASDCGVYKSTAVHNSVHILISSQRFFCVPVQVEKLQRIGVILTKGGAATLPLGDYTEEHKKVLMSAAMHVSFQHA